MGTVSGVWESVSGCVWLLGSPPLSIQLLAGVCWMCHTQHGKRASCWEVAGTRSGCSGPLGAGDEHAHAVLPHDQRSQAHQLDHHH